MAIEVHEPTVQYFERELQRGNPTDGELIVLFGNISSAVDEATKEALMAVLKEYRPQVAQRVEHELEAIREP
jgi:hypothetical protein